MENFSGLTIAATHEIYSAMAVERKLQKLDPSAHEDQALIKLYEQMLAHGTERFIVTPSSLACLDPMYESCRNFTPLIDELRGAILLANEGQVPMTMDPILLLGEPGVGKTHFASMLGKLLGTGYAFVSMSQMTAGWILGGASTQWKGARKGKIAETLINDLYANPVVVIDEIDKAGGQKEYDPMGTLYSLLEGDTARGFIDEYVDIPLDASKIFWIATANDERNIPSPILNRMKVITIDKPTKEHIRAIVCTMYADTLKEQHWNFVEKLSDDVLDVITSLPPRTMKLMLMSAFRMAKLAGRDHLLPRDIAGVRQEKRPIGF